MSADILFKTAILQASRIGMDSPDVALPLYGRTPAGERIAVLDGRLLESKRRIGFLVLRSSDGDNGTHMTVCVDRAPVETIIKDRSGEAYLISLPSHQDRVVAGMLALHLTDPSRSTINGQPVASEDFHDEPAQDEATLIINFVGSELVPAAA